MEKERERQKEGEKIVDKEEIVSKQILGNYFFVPGMALLFVSIYN